MEYNIRQILLSERNGYMKILILGGFLGSGKTTVLLDLAKYLTGTANVDKTKVVIIENEVSDTGIDSRLFENDYKVENMFSGCVCCTFTGEFEWALKQISENYDPEWIIVEATGLAYPDAIKETIVSALGITPGVLTLVDSQRWFKYLRALNDFVMSQLSEANVVFINKSDLVGEEDAKKIEESLRGINSSAKVFKTIANTGFADEFWNDVISEMEI